MTVVSATTAAPLQTTQAASGRQQTIQRGDTLSGIAKQNGVSLSALRAANPQILNPNVIYPGDRISIPGGQSQSASSNAPVQQSAKPAANTTAAAKQTNSTQLSMADYQRAASKLGVDVASIRAVADVESSGGGFLADGRPKILFERHIFARETGGRYNSSHPGISGPAGGYGAGGANQHLRFDQAYALNPTAAMKSASWGEFQIMGFNHKMVGYDSVGKFVEAMRSSAGKQLDAFVSFIESAGLKGALQRKDWAGFAKGYNGAGYAKNNYDGKMAAAYAKYAGSNPPPVTNTKPTPPVKPTPSPAPSTGGNYSVRSGDTFGGIAQKHGVSESALRSANPQIRNVNLIYPGQSIKIPGGSTGGSKPAATSHTVRSGDTFGGIAQKHGVSQAALRSANPQISNINRIYVGQSIKIPGKSGGSTKPAATSHTVRNGETFGGIAQKHGVSQAALRSANPQISNINRIYVGQKIKVPGSATKAPVPAKPAPKPKPAATYTVRSGDTFGGIAQKHGVSQAALRSANPQISNINVISVGQRINLPGGSKVAPTPPVTGGKGSNAASIAHKYLGWSAGNLKVSGHLPMNRNVPNTVCCANFVSAVLQKAGLINFHTDLVTGSNWNAKGALGTMLKARGWSVVPASQARPGDVAIVNNGRHTELVYSNKNGKITLIGSNNTNGGSGPQKISYGNPYGNAWYLTPPRK